MKGSDVSHDIALSQIAAARGSVPRNQIENAVNQFLSSYATADWKTRTSLLSEDVVFEDTVGVPPPAVGRDEAEAYFRSVLDAGIEIQMEPLQIIIMGNEAFTTTRAAWGYKGNQPECLRLVQNFHFNENGEICRVRIAYDEGCFE